MSHPVVMHIRISRNHEKRVRELSAKTGLNTSQMIRELIENAEVEERKVQGLRTSFPVNANSDAQTLAGRVAVAR